MVPLAEGAKAAAERAAEGGAAEGTAGAGKVAAGVAAAEQLEVASEVHLVVAVACAGPVKA